MDDQTPPTPPKPPRTAADRRYAVLVGVGLAVAAACMALAIARTNTDPDTPPSVASRPDIVDRLVPPNRSQGQRQSELGIDLAAGYEATLIVNGIQIPDDQLRRVAQQGEVFFTPGEGKVIEQLDAGQTCVTAVVWQSSVGRGTADKTFQWCFGVI